MTEHERITPRRRAATAIMLLLVAPTREALTMAVETMKLRHGPDVAFNVARQDRRRAWRATGTLFIREP